MFSTEVWQAQASSEKVLLRVFVHFYGDRTALLLDD